MSNSETQKEDIADLYHRVASAYGQIGPNIFGYGGQHLVERIAMTEGARALDVGAGRGANLFPAAEAVGPQGQVMGTQSDGIHETLRLQYILASKRTQFRQIASS